MSWVRAGPSGARTNPMRKRSGLEALPRIRLISKGADPLPVYPGTREHVSLGLCRHEACGAQRTGHHRLRAGVSTHQCLRTSTVTMAVGIPLETTLMVHRRAVRDQLPRAERTVRSFSPMISPLLATARDFLAVQVFGDRAVQRLSHDTPMHPNRWDLTNGWDVFLLEA